MSDVTLFTNGEGFKEYAESLSPYERDTTPVMTTVTAIRSFEIDLEIVTAERDRLQDWLDDIRAECEETVRDCGDAEELSYADGNKDQAMTTLEMIAGPTIIEYGDDLVKPRESDQITREGS